MRGILPPEFLLRRSWLPTLTVIGAAGFPSSLQEAGNVLRPSTTLRLSVRLPPTIDSKVAAEALKTTFETEPPHGAKVTFELQHVGNGWNAPSLAPWLEQSLERASMTFFGKQSAAIGEGGGIPFMGRLGEKFPEAQFVVTGVLGPGSNAHGPNEFLEISMAIRLTASVAMIMMDHAIK